MRNFLFFFVLFILASKANAESSCPNGFYKVTTHFRRGYIRADGTTVKATQVRSYCKEASSAYNFWFKRVKSGLPKDWPHKNEKSATWTLEEKERLLEALESIPTSLWLDSIANIYRSKKSKDYPNPASQAKGLIVLYDSSFDEKRNLSRILSHELAHESYDRLPAEDQMDYRRVTGWGFELRGRTAYWKGRESGYVEDDGRRLPLEDYANNIEYYLFDPQKLKETTPAAYNWIKKHFGDNFKVRGDKK